jgi:WD40 repeat protein
VLYDDKFDDLFYDNLVTSIEFSANEKYLLVKGNNNAVRVLEADTGKEVASIVHDDLVDSATFSLDSNYVISESSDFVSGRSDVRVWKIGNRQEITSMIPDGNNMPTNVVTSAFTPDGKYEAWLEGNVVHIVDAATGDEIAHMTHDKRVASIAFSPNGNYIISGSVDKTARVWEVATGNEIARMNHDSWVYYVAFSPDGRYVASGDVDGTSRVWESDTGKEIARMSYAGPVFSVAFSPDGKYVVSTGCYQFFPGSNVGYCMTGIVQTWMYHPEDLIADACSRVTRNLTRAEWAQYIGDVLPYQAVCPNLPIEPEPTPTP